MLFVNNLKKFYLFLGLVNLCLSLISVFIPTYLLQQGFSLTQVLFFTALFYGMAFFINPLGAYIIRKFSVKTAFLISLPLLACFNYLLPLLRGGNYLSLAILYGLAYSLFWYSYHVSFSVIGDNDRRGTETSITFIIRDLTSILGPIAGATIIALFGYPSLFFVGIGLSIFALIIILKIPILYFKNEPETKSPSFIRDVFNKQPYEYGNFIGHGMAIGAGMVWSIYIYLFILNDYAILGIVTGFAALASTLSKFLFGKMTDKYPGKTLIFGSVSHAIMWLIKPFVGTTFQVFGIDFFEGITSSAKDIPFNSLAYNEAKRTNPIAYNLFRELIIAVGVMFIVLLSLFSIKIAFVIGGLGSLLYLWRKWDKVYL